MFNIGDLIINSLDYIFIVDINYKIIYNTRYDENLNDECSKLDASDMIGKSFFEAYPKIRREESSIVECLKTRKIIVKKRQYYEDYEGHVYFTNNVTFPLLKRGKLIAAVELSMDAGDRNDISGLTGAERVFDEFVSKLQLDAGIITFDSILTVNKNMLNSIEKAKLFAMLPNPTLIYGETGTGKELFAQAMISYRSLPKSKVVIQNCAAVPESLIESILFGTVKGTYTGAENKKGLFQIADGGIIFLDELNSIPYNVQSKLLRVLQDGTFMPIGASKEVKVSVKVIAAMNIDPVKAMEANIIRKDLFYRFSGGLLTLPPLRKRKEDISLYINYYMRLFSKMYGKNAETIVPDVRTLFFAYPWEGNVRELKNVIESMVIFAGNETMLTLDHIPAYMLEYMQEKILGCTSEHILKNEEEINKIYERIISGEIKYEAVIDEMEEQLTRIALSECGGNESKAAKLLGLPRQTLRYKLGKGRGKPKGEF